MVKLDRLVPTWIVVIGVVSWGYGGIVLELALALSAACFDLPFPERL